MGNLQLSLNRDHELGRTLPVKGRQSSYLSWKLKHKSKCQLVTLHAEINLAMTFAPL